MSARYLVRHGDTLWGIAQKRLGNPGRWSEIARKNHLSDPDRLFIGQELVLPESFQVRQQKLVVPNQQFSTQIANTPANEFVGRAFFFAVADEINPLTKKFVRRVSFPVSISDPELIRKILAPDQYGFFPRDPSSQISMAGHVKGMVNSKYISLSEFNLGATRHGGKPFFIDAKALERSGVEIIPHEELLTSIREALAKEQVRLQTKVNSGGSAKSISNLERSVATYERAMHHATIDRELLAVGEIPASTIKGPGSMLITRSLQVVGVVGVVLTTYDLGKAGVESVKQGSIKPLSQEGTQQGTGWAAGVAGGWAGRRAAMWAGMRIGGSLGALFTSETGPGALAGGAIGGLICGAVGFIWGPEMVEKIVPDRFKSYVVSEEKPNQ